MIKLFKTAVFGIAFILSANVMAQTHKIDLSGTLTVSPFENSPSATNIDTGLNLQLSGPFVLSSHLTFPNTNFLYLNSDVLIRSNTSFDYEATNNGAFIVTIIGNNGTVTATTTFTVTIQNLNDQPQIERQIANQTLEVGSSNHTLTFAADTFSDQDENSVLTYTAVHPGWLSFNASNRSFVAATLAERGTFTVSVIATDNGISGSNYKLESNTLSFEYIVGDVPVINVVGSQVTIEEAATITITRTGLNLSITDADGGVSLVLSPSDSRFTINTDSNNAIEIKPNSSFDYETQSLYILTVAATDNLKFKSSLVFTINIADNPDERPYIVRSGSLLSRINEGTFPSGQDLGYRYDFIDPEGLSLSIGITGDERFYLRDNNQLYIVNGAKFDYANVADRRINLEVKAQDPGGNYVIDQIVIDLNDIYQVIQKTGELPSLNFTSGDNYLITLAKLYVTDTGRTGNIDYSISGNPDWLTLTDSSAGVLSVAAPYLAASTVSAMTVVVRHSGGVNNSNSNITYTVGVRLLERDFTAVNEVVLPRILDQVVKHSSGAIVNRISRLAANDLTSTWDRELVAALTENQEKINNGEINIYQLLQGREYALGFHNQNNTGKVDFGVWSRIDFSQFDGENVKGVTYDGEILGINLGADYRFVNGGILGLGLGVHSGNANYSQIVDNQTRNGEYKLKLNVLQPYYSANYRNAIDYYVSFGLGKGDVDIKDALLSGTTFENDLSLYTGALGFDTNVYRYSQNSSLEVFGDLSQSKMVVTPSSKEQETKTTNRNFRSGINLKQEQSSNDGYLVGKLGIALVNHSVEANDDHTAWGHEFFTEVDYVMHSRPLRINGDLSYLIVSSENQRNLSGGFSVNYRDDISRLGAFVELNPAYRSKSQKDLFDLGYDNTKDVIGDPRLVFSSKVGYGFGVFSGILTPYGNYEIDKQSKDYSLGVRYLRDDKLTIGLGLNRSNTKLDDTKFELQYKIID